jgi:hypothetical protein
MKRRLAEDEGFTEVYAKCVQLKLPSADGKQRLTDVADTETLLRIIQSVPSPKAEPIKQWLAQVGAERLRERANPALEADRLRREYRRLGYADEWINARLEHIVTRTELTTEWRERGAEEGREFAILTDVLNQGTFGLTTSDHKQVKGIGQRQNLPDNMTSLELVLTSLASATSTAIHQANDSQGFAELQHDAKQAGGIAGATRREIEAATGQPIVSPENARSLRQGRQRELPAPLLDEAGDEE